MSFVSIESPIGTHNRGFYDLLRSNLSNCQSPEFPGLVGLDFVNMLPMEEVIRLLERRLQAIEAELRRLDKVCREIRENHLSVDYLHHNYATELKWLTKVIDRLKST